MSFISCFQIGNSIWRSNSVCICPFDDNIARCKNVRRRYCYKNKSEHRLGHIYHVCCYSMLFVSNTRILSNRSSRPRCSLKRGSPINSAKPTLTGKTYAKAFLHITKRLRHIYSIFNFNFTIDCVKCITYFFYRRALHLPKIRL